MRQTMFAMFEQSAQTMPAERLRSSDQEPAITANNLPAHRSDPATSLAAAVAINKDGTRAAQKKQVLTAVIRFGGRTSRELSKLSGIDRHVVARRLPDLEDDSLVRRGQRKICRESSKRLLAETWWATAAGVAALQSTEHRPPVRHVAPARRPIPARQHAERDGQEFYRPPRIHEPTRSFVLGAKRQAVSAGQR